MAPSAEHEARVSTLVTLATLAGCVADVRLGERAIPDVCRLDQKRHALFVGDAKYAEVPGAIETRIRLARYADHILDWCAAGYAVWFVVCAPATTSAQVLDWVRLLLSSLDRLGMRVRRRWAGRLGEDQWIVAAVVSADTVLGYTYASRTPSSGRISGSGSS